MSYSSSSVRFSGVRSCGRLTREAPVRTEPHHRRPKTMRTMESSNKSARQPCRRKPRIRPRISGQSCRLEVTPDRTEPPTDDDDADEQD